MNMKNMNIKQKPLKNSGQKKRRTKQMQRTAQKSWKAPPSRQFGPDPLGETIHVVEVIDDSYMMPEQSTAKLNDLHRDISSFIQRQDGAVDKISKFLENQRRIQENQGNIQENQGKIQDTMLSHLNDHGKAIRTLLEKLAQYDKIIPHLERKTTLTDRRVNSVEQKVDSFAQKVDSVAEKVDRLLKAKGKSSNSEGKKHGRRMAKCKFCDKEMLKASVARHVRRKNCPVLRSTDEVTQMKVKPRGKRIL